MFPSYKSVRKDLIFEPTADEKLAFEKDNECKLDLHMINIYYCVHFILGDRVDRKGKHYLEFQDSLCDIKNGDRDFLRFAFEPNTVAECVLFKKLERNVDHCVEKKV
ncbi:hypothetical protein HID58_039625 [Brassica napus]|uniref:Uncharacterized protein n=1 Tax=Brassica napus TaxID=3708 RepID=A0ABQ8BSR4_BRANA|nr:hypothetical protein HID58_039625 [Brassica napus]